MNNDDYPILSQEQEQYFLKTFPLIKRIARRRMKHRCQDKFDDLLQIVSFKLLNWRTNENGHDLTQDEWMKMANTVTIHEIQRMFESEGANGMLILSLDNEKPNGVESRVLSGWGIEGNTNLELRSILKIVWANVVGFSLLEKMAYIFHIDELVDMFLMTGCCGMGEFAEALNLTREEFVVLIENLPLSDKQLIDFIEQKLSVKMKSKQLKDARYRVRLKLTKALADSNHNERTLVAGANSSSFPISSERP